MQTTYIPVLAIPEGVMDIDFYKHAFGAVELWRIKNADGTIHVAAFIINGAEFRLHQESQRGASKSPRSVTGATTVTIALTTDDVHDLFNQAIKAGAKASMPVTDFEYGYRQGVIEDPFGHLWQIEKLLSSETFNRFLKQLPSPQ